LDANTTGQSNVSLGYQALGANITGSNNTAVGTEASLVQTTAANNTAVGLSALRNNTSNSLTAVGTQALESNTTGSQNAAIGFSALKLNTTGSNNLAVGANALLNNTTGLDNVAIGNLAQQGDGVTAITGEGNVSVGFASMFRITSGFYDTAVGELAMINNKTGSENTALGAISLFGNTEGSFHTALGRDALRLSTSSLLTVGTITGGSGYVDGTYTGVTLIRVDSGTVFAFTAPVATIVVSGGAVTTVTITSGGASINSSMIFSANNASLGGSGSGFQAPVATLDTPVSNTAVGYKAGRNSTSGSRNVFLGNNAGYFETTSDNLYISNSDTSTPLIYGKFDSTGGSTTGRVKINGNLEINSKTPASASATGVVGEIAWDADYIYICTATNTWKRVGIATW
jgi:hypothetical protein